MVSVCMATHNGDAFLKEQIDSILSQLDLADELIIADDNSSDDTVQIIDTYNDPRIKLVRHKSAIGVSRNFESALNECKGDYIFLTDQDDVWLPDKKRISLEYLRHYDLVVSDCLIVDKSLAPEHSSFYNLNGSKKGFLKNLIKNSYMGCCMAFRRGLLKFALPFPLDIPMHDQWIGMVGELHGKVHFMNEVLIYHRKHLSNVTTTGKTSQLTFGKKISSRYRILKNILRRSYAR